MEKPFSSRFSQGVLETPVIPDLVGNPTMGIYDYCVFMLDSCLRRNDAYLLFLRCVFVPIR